MLTEMLDIVLTPKFWAPEIGGPRLRERWGTV